MEETKEMCKVCFPSCEYNGESVQRMTLIRWPNMDVFVHYTTFMRLWKRYMNKSITKLILEATKNWVEKNWRQT